MEAVEKFRKTVPDSISWQREYLLKIIAEEGRLIRPEWIKNYDEPPEKENSEYRFSAIGIDLAISQSEAADYTAMVSADICGYGDDTKIYILPYPVNEKFTHLETLDCAENLCRTIAGGPPAFLYVEDVGYQGAVVEQLKKRGLPVEGVKPHGQDKRARLNLTTGMLQSGRILFPRKGAERLIEQLVGFGSEKHDDLADAFAILINKIMEKNHSRPAPFPNIAKRTDPHISLDQVF